MLFEASLISLDLIHAQCVKVIELISVHAIQKFIVCFWFISSFGRFLVHVPQMELPQATDKDGLRLRVASGGDVVLKHTLDPHHCPSFQPNDLTRSMRDSPRLVMKLSEKKWRWNPWNPKPLQVAKRWDISHHIHLRKLTWIPKQLPYLKGDIF